jgi:hypothetical protein
MVTLEVKNSYNCGISRKKLRKEDVKHKYNGKECLQWRGYVPSDSYVLFDVTF